MQYVFELGRNIEHSSTAPHFNTKVQFPGWTVSDIKAIDGDMSLIKRQSAKRSRRAAKQHIHAELDMVARDAHQAAAEAELILWY